VDGATHHQSGSLVCLLIGDISSTEERKRSQIRDESKIRGLF
jgi:hypothetical protein